VSAISDMDLKKAMAINLRRERQAKGLTQEELADRASPRFATTVASGPATLATKRTLLLTWAGLAPAGSHQLCLAHLFDYLVGASKQRKWHRKPERLGRLEIDCHLDFGDLLHR
jgi:hypothetical protein